MRTTRVVQREPAGEARVRGFTLLEVVATFIVLGVLAAFAATRLTSDNDSRRRADLDMLIASVRQVQMRSMSTVTPWSIQINANSFTTSPSALPGHNAATVALPKLTVSSGGNLTFDPWGSPGEANVTIVTSAGSFCVHRVTGFIQIPSCT